MKSFSAFTRLFPGLFVQTVGGKWRPIDCLYNNKRITQWLEDMNFIFSY